MKPMKSDKWVVTYIPDGTKSVSVFAVFSDEESATDKAIYMSEVYSADTWIVTKAKFFDSIIKAYKSGMPIDPPM